MLKTNSKKAIENIRKYIIDNFNGYEDKESEQLKMDVESDSESNFPTLARYILDKFYWEKVHYNARNNMSNFQLFEEWAQGLPSVISCDYYYFPTAVNDLGDILEETDEERNKYTETQAENLLTKLIYRELSKFDY